MTPRRPSFSPASLCDKQGHQWRRLRPPSGKPFERCVRCRMERGGDPLPAVPDDVAATRLVSAAKAGTLPRDVAVGVLYLNRVRAEQSLVIRQLQKAAGLVRLPPRSRRH